ncbi:MAG: 6-carboxyhexanoate--CoA ligase [Nitrospirae bacterium]|nr:6-carboxyhexanoate--CoA ligase [Nitrospirota bacterium]MBI5695514.1 6-carboxyhexanoate--CoA ligase [Nitrospirota bacterium]
MSDNRLATPAINAMCYAGRDALGAPDLYSLRMRASSNGRHISGAERIVGGADVARVTSELVERARAHALGTPDAITVTVDSLAGRHLVRLHALPVTDIRLAGADAGNARAVAELVRAGVSEEAARAALSAMTTGASDGGGMRGAMILDAATGNRLDGDGAKGVRARAIDYDESSRPLIDAALAARGLEGSRIREALALATKVAHAPGAVAELCISDNPGYVTGYVASSAYGYVRLTPLKEPGSFSGGRAFFVDGARLEMEDYLHYLREVPVLVEGPLVFSPPSFP